MAAFVKFHCFVQDLGRGVHDLHADALKVMLTNVAPSASGNAVKADVTEIAAGGGYSAGGYTLANKTYAQSGGTARLLADDPLIEASGAAMAGWRYAVLYNDTPTSPADPLIGYWDYGATISLDDGDSRTLDLPPTREVLTLS